MPRSLPRRSRPAKPQLAVARLRRMKESPLIRGETTARSAGKLSLARLGGLALYSGSPVPRLLTLLEVARLRTAARRAGLTDITMAGSTSGSRRSSCPIPGRSGCSGCTRRQC